MKGERQMSVRTGMILLAFTAVSFAGLGLIAGSRLPAVPEQKPPTQEKLWVDSETRQASVQKMPQEKVCCQELSSFAPLVKKASPAVVNISFERTVSMSPRGNPFGGGGGGANDPFGEFFERFFGQNIPREYKNKGLGSGFLIDGDGYIVTNNHVIENADKVVVRLKDEDKDYVAKVVGKDSKTDIALIKIDGAKNLAWLPMGDSDKMEVGDWVVAIGNPLGLSDTVTKGIVSFKGRKNISPSGQPGYYDFIQTDAPINPGNSGGPLLNTSGEVIGVNESMVGGAQNIGFAVPINMVKAVIPSLREHGKVVRSWLGIQIQPVSQNLADSFGMKKPEGALIADIVPGGPAEKAGIKPGDVIVEFNGKKIIKSEDLPWLASTAGIGTEARVKIFRDGQAMELKVVLGEMPEEGKGGKALGQKGKGGEELGLVVRPVPPEIAERMNLKPGKGVIVISARDGSIAAEAGVTEEDVILKVNNIEVNSPGDFVNAVKSVKSGSMIRLFVRRGEGNLFIAFRKE